MPDFKKSLAVGKTGESEIATWFRGKGYNVLPVYEIAENQFKGPAVIAFDGGEIIAPDMLVFNTNKAWWIEAKHKSAFTWHRITKQWVTGIDLHHYDEYQKINRLAIWPVWLMFLHKDGIAKDTPKGMKSPTGLYGNSLDYLFLKENHRHRNYGKTGMVYWSVANLKKIADYPIVEVNYAN